MNPPANWYPDPLGHHEQRYWDGTQWTEHVFTAGVQGVDPLLVSEDEAAATDGDDEPVGGASSEPSGEVRDDDHDLFTEPGDEDGDEAVVDAGVVTDDGADEEPTVAEDTAAPGLRGDTFVMTNETIGRYVKHSHDAEDASSDAPGDDEHADEPDDAGEQPAAGGEASEQPAGEDEAVEPQPVDASTDGGDHAFDDAAFDRAGDDPAAGPPPSAADLVDAAPPVVPPAASLPPDQTGPADVADGASDGPVGLRGSLLEGAYAERDGTERVALQNARLLRCHMTVGEEIVARQGTMVAFQGQMSFRRQGAGGVGRALKRAATGEGLAMMRVGGAGDVFFADGAQHVFLLHLEGGPGLSVNGRNVLAFSGGLDWDIERVRGASLLAGGLFNTTLRGHGWVALVSDGEPVVLRTDDAPTFVDVNALVAWSAGLTTRVVNSVSAASVVGLGSGEAFQMAFDGDGVVIVQPSEGWAQGGTSA